MTRVETAERSGSYLQRHSLLRLAPKVAILCFVAQLALAATAASAGPPSSTISPEQREFFESKVRPLLVENCLSCHGANSKPLRGNLRLDTRAGLLKGGDRGPSFTPAKPETSLLLTAINYADKNLQMPPKSKLSDAQIATLAEWVKQGAFWPEEGSRRGDKAKGRQGTKGSPAPTATLSAFNLAARKKQHWAWQPVRAQSVPKVRQTAWPRSPIDNFVLAGLEAKGLKPAPPADRRTLLRRVTYDLLGLPPTPGEVSDFLADKSSNAWEKVVDRLLASPHYGERWGRHWLDLVRYAETDGHEWDMEKTGAWQYRDYVVRALNADVPYNQFVQEQIAGDLLPHPRLNPTEHFNEAILGTGFFWLGSCTHSPVDLREDEEIRIDNQIDVFGKAFLGLGVGCARCHDHKFDAISTKDYYALYGVFKSSRQQEFPLAPPLTAGMRHDLNAVNADLQGTLRQSAAQNLNGPSFPPDKEWSARIEEARGNPAAILHPLAVLSAPDATRSPAAFCKAREELLKRLREQTAHAQQESRAITWILNPEAGAKTSDWSLSGEACSSPADALTLRPDLDKVGHLLAACASNTLDTGRLSDKLQGAFRSPTFTIAKPTILYQMLGKDARVRLVIDGYQRLRDPLYGGLEFTFNSPTRATWRAQDVRPWIGHRAYIEILDNGPGFVTVQRVGLGENGPPADMPNPLVVQMLDDPALTSLADLNRKMDGLFRQSGAWLTSNPAQNAPEADARRDFLQSALPTVTLPAPVVAHLAQLLEQRKQVDARIATPQPALTAADGTGENERIHIRGTYNSPGPEVPRRFLEACDGSAQPFSSEGSGRLQLAQRLTAPSNPLLARVLVNRAWQRHFGEGLVRTPDDFGVMGQPPTHPELLEWLATNFAAKGVGSRVSGVERNATTRVLPSKQSTSRNQRIDYPTPDTLSPTPYACGWSLKKLHRLLLLSATYQMSSTVDPRAELLDPQNKLLHHIPVRRLEAECIRDAILAASGRLDTTLYGPPVMPHLTEFTPGRGAPASGPLDGNGRRSLYISVRRNFPLPFFTAFDYPVPTTTIGRRTVSNVPAQALALLNDPFVLEQAGVWAKRILAQPGTTPQRIDVLYETAFARFPSPTEREAALAFLTQRAQADGHPDDPRAWADLCHVLINVKEFIFIR